MIRSNAPSRVSSANKFLSVNIQIVDQTQDLERYYTGDNIAEASHVPPENSNASTPARCLPSLSQTTSPPKYAEDASAVIHSALSRVSLSPTVHSHESISKRRKTNHSTHSSSSRPSDPATAQYQWSTPTSDFSPRPLSTPHNFQEPSPLPIGYGTPTNPLRSENGRLPDSAAAALPSAASGLLSPRVWKDQFYWPNGKPWISPGPAPATNQSNSIHNNSVRLPDASLH